MNPGAYGKGIKSHYDEDEYQEKCLVLLLNTASPNI
jgi:hypothetical protein